MSRNTSHPGIGGATQPLRSLPIIIAFSCAKLFNRSTSQPTRTSSSLSPAHFSRQSINPHNRMMTKRLASAAYAAALLISAPLVRAAAVAPNQFLGSCLTAEWVASMEKALGVDSTSRDALGRLEHPFLHAAHKNPVYKIKDPRTARATAYRADCIPDKSYIYGAGAKVDPTTGAVLSTGVTNGTLVLELNDWTTHSLTSLVFSIIAAEAYGFQVSHYVNEATVPMTERMSSVGAGQCTPTHLNLEVWGVGTKPSLMLFRNETSMAGDAGYEGRSGLYTTVDFVTDSMDKTQHTPPLYADFWKGYRFDEALITAIPVSSLRNNANFFPPPNNKNYCKDGSYGCSNHCSKTIACEDRETQGGECMVVAMMVDYFDPGYLQAVMNNIGIPTYFCFIGFGGMQNFALDAQQKGRPVLFYHYEPDLFHIEHPNLFQRVFLPRSSPERGVLANGQFGGAYNKATTNPVDVDFAATKLAKYAAKVLQTQTDNPVSQLVSKFSISELHMNDLLRRYRDQSAIASVVDPTFEAACAWVRSNYDEWTKWLDRQPLCDFDTHVQYSLVGCDSENDTDSSRSVVFEWKNSNPQNKSLPMDCDGGLRSLPPPLKTSRSCSWITSDLSKWRSWTSAKPTCDGSFYKYNITGCDKNAKRTVKYWWLLPHPVNASTSLECTGGEVLPADVLIDCDYMPTNTAGFVAVAVIAVILIGVLIVALFIVVLCRERPIIRRSQWEFLALVIIGGILMCVAALLYAGEPSQALCGARPAFTAAAFTTIFGSLFVKSMRVYRVFMKSAFKKATITTVMMGKVLAGLVVVDAIIIGAWFIADYPRPTIEILPAKEFRGDVDHISCSSSSFIFTALLIFWKTIVLLMGIYASFLIRNVSTDFQESVWMFASSMTVLIGCLVILPLAYLVDMPASAFYIFLAGCLLVCTALVMAFMLVPKLTRLQAEASTVSSKYASQPSTKGAEPSRHSSGQVQPNASSGKPKRTGSSSS